MPEFLYGNFIDITFYTALQVVVLGFIGGILSGFIGSGGAFFMTPGMMNLGVPGVLAVGSNITHKFGKAMVGAKAHGKMGHVDKKLGIFMLFTAFAGIRLAVWINSMLFKGGGGSHGAGGGAAANLYISLVFACILSIVAISMLKDVWSHRNSTDDQGPSTKIADFLGNLNLFPIINFPVADVKISLWIILLVGLATGYLAGTIGVGGFIGVPAMIYVFGIPTAVATGTELYLAMYMGAWGALNYAIEGFVDIRLTLLLYIGSLIGIHLGVYGTKVVSEVLIRLVTGIIILLCVISRIIAIPVYLRQLECINYNVSYDVYFNSSSKFMLFAAGLSGAGIIFYKVIRTYWKRMQLQKSLDFSVDDEAPA